MVRFALVRDEDGRAPVDGWPPPVDSEGLWASAMGGGRYRIENTPWFAQNLATYDLVEAVEYEGIRWVMRKAEWSGHLTVRVAHIDPVAYQIAALDIPPDADYRAIIGRLRAGRSDGIWDYEESCVSTDWRGL